jgi:uncharacterized protein YPO0396
MDARGTAIIGPTGSGKTTLVDALMTLLVAQPRYNLASTGGHESDRDLMSYLRGVTGPGAGPEGGDAHVARPGKTTTGIAATFGNGEEAVQLVALLWTDGPGFAAADRSDVWLFVRGADAPDLPHWLALLHDGGPRALKKEARDTAGVQPFDTRKAYLAQLRRFFEVGDNAFTLLNRAAGLKQLNSIDDIFRELVLDDQAKHAQAAEVVKEFDTLVGIHEELLRALAQQQSLQPIARLDAERAIGMKEQAFAQRHLAAIPGWYALAARDSWAAQAHALQLKRDESLQRKTGLEERIQRREEATDVLRTKYAQVGGDSLQTKLSLLQLRERALAEATRHAADYARLATTLGLPAAETADAVASNRATLQESQPDQERKADALRQTAYQAGGLHHAAEAALTAARAAMAQARSRPGSNIPGDYQDFRAALADAVGLLPQALPFVAEMVQVPPPHRRWRGAIERALGGERLRLLVPADCIEAALRWVNARHNRLHVRLLDADAIRRQARERRAEPFADGFARMLDVREHALAPALRDLLALNDRHCVDSPEVLRDTEHAMTAEGLLSGQRGRFDKHDQRRLDEGWLTGFDNRDQLHTLEGRIAELQQELAHTKAAFDSAQAQDARQQQQLALRRELLAVEFSAIDTAEPAAELQALSEQIALLQQPGSELATLGTQIDEMQRETTRLRGEMSVIDREIGGLETQYTAAQKEAAEAGAQAPAQGVAAFADDLRSQLPNLGAVPAAHLAGLQKEALRHQQQRLEELGSQLSRLAQHLVRAMEGAKKVDTGELADARTELDDVPAYLDRLRVLDQEALPEKRERFRRYLNQSSDQGVSQLLHDIEADVSVIEDRIEDLNATLARVEFQPGRHLQLVTRKVAHQALRDLQAAHRHLRSATLRPDDPEGHFAALQDVVRQLRQASDNRRTLGARSVLDPRWRLEFAVSLIETATQRTVETRTGSQGGSGGEKEIIASYILTASLSYALVPEGQELPRFATVVLDEAFSRTSQTVAARIVAALRAFGLHPLFITPNKEMRLLREHTRSAIVVTRRGAQSRLVSLRWEELDTQALARTAGIPS